MPSHMGEDRVLRRLLGNRSYGFYLDVGANDPLTSSNSHPFYLDGWRGIDVEPIPELAHKLRYEHAMNVVVECAVGSANGRTTLFTPPNTELATVRLDIIQRHIKKFPAFEGNCRPLDVSVRTLDDILTEHAEEPIAFMSLDVEGSETAALAGMNLAKWQPEVIVIEAVMPDSTEPTWQEWEPMLLSAGYQLAETDIYNRYYMRV